MHFVKLTSLYGETPAFVNLSKVTRLYECEDTVDGKTRNYTRLVFDAPDDYFDAKESPERIFATVQANV